MAEPEELIGAWQAAKKAVRELQEMTVDNYLEQELEIEVAVKAVYTYLSDHGLLLTSEARGIIEAARQMVADRNEAYGNASRPAWWNGFDWPVVKAVADYEKAGKRDPS